MAHLGEKTGELCLIWRNMVTAYFRSIYKIKWRNCGYEDELEPWQGINDAYQPFIFYVLVLCSVSAVSNPLLAGSESPIAVRNEFYHWWCLRHLYGKGQLKGGGGVEAAAGPLPLQTIYFATEISFLWGIILSCALPKFVTVVVALPSTIKS